MVSAFHSALESDYRELRILYHQSRRVVLTLKLVAPFDSIGNRKFCSLVLDVCFNEIVIEFQFSADQKNFANATRQIYVMH